MVFQGEKQGRALLDLRLRPDVAAVFGHDPMHDGQSHSGAFKLIRAAESLENAEKVSRKLHVKPRSVVPRKVMARTGSLKLRETVYENDSNSLLASSSAVFFS